MIRNRGERNGWEIIPLAPVCSTCEWASLGHGPATQHRRQKAGPLFSCTAWGANHHGFRVREWAPDQDDSLSIHQTDGAFVSLLQSLPGQLQAHGRWTGPGGAMLGAGRSCLAPSGPAGVPAKGQHPAPSATPASPASGWECPVLLASCMTLSYSACFVIYKLMLIVPFHRTVVKIK